VSENGTWVPRSRRDDPEAAKEYRALQEGVPPWLTRSLWNWARPFLRASDELGQSFWLGRELARIERVLGIELSWRLGVRSAGDSLATQVQTNGELLLDLIDLLLRDLDERWEAPDLAAELEAFLAQGRSVWRVAERGRQLALERRVDASVTAAAEAAMEAPGSSAGDHLSRAWSKAYGREPDPSAAYAEAVKAVEAAAKPVVTPKDDKATLGKMVSAFRDRSEKWDVVLAAASGFDKVDVVRLMAEQLWQGHTDRHGRPDPVPVTQEQAEAAVHLAALLVQWFTAGSIRTQRD
jgi:hypothetical protein